MESPYFSDAGISFAPDDVGFGALFFRFTAALLLVVLVSMVAVALEKQTLEMKRAVSRQYFQKDLLLEMHAKLRLDIQRQTSVSRMVAGDSPQMQRPPAPDRRLPAVSDANADTPHKPVLPLLRWQHPWAND